MGTIASTREQSRAHNGKTCEKVRAVTPDDENAYDPSVAKTIVRLDDGTEVPVANHEIIE